MSADSPIIRKELREYVDILGYSESPDKGRVYDPDNQTDSTRAIRSLNEKIKNDKRVEHSILTIYDGMTICYIK